MEAMKKTQAVYNKRDSGAKWYRLNREGMTCVSWLVEGPR